MIWIILVCFGFVVVHPVTSLLQNDLISTHSTKIVLIFVFSFPVFACLCSWRRGKERRQAVRSQRSGTDVAVCIRALLLLSEHGYCASSVLVFLLFYNTSCWMVFCCWCRWIGNQRLPCPVLADRFSPRCLFCVELLVFRRQKTPLKTARRWWTPQRIWISRLPKTWFTSIESFVSWGRLSPSSSVFFACS